MTGIADAAAATQKIRGHLKLYVLLYHLKSYTSDNWWTDDRVLLLQLLLHRRFRGHLKLYVLLYHVKSYTSDISNFMFYCIM